MYPRIILLAVLASACAQRAPEQRADLPHSYAEPSQRPEAPAVVRWQKKSADANRLVLVAQIDVRSPMPQPVQVSVQLPAGTKLVQGESSFTLAPAEKPQLVEREYVFEVTGQPAGDLVLIADAQTPVFGFHATDAYRFGRPERTVRPQANGPEIRVGGSSLGRAVPMDAPAKQ